MLEHMTVDNIIDGIKTEHQLCPTEPVRFEISPINAQQLIEDHEAEGSCRDLMEQESNESFEHLKKSIDAAQSVVDLLQQQHKKLTGVRRRCPRW